MSHLYANVVLRTFLYLGYNHILLQESFIVFSKCPPGGYSGRISVCIKCHVKQDGYDKITKRYAK